MILLSKLISILVSLDRDSLISVINQVVSNRDDISRVDIYTSDDVIKMEDYFARDNKKPVL